MEQKYLCNFMIIMYVTHYQYCFVTSRALLVHGGDAGAEGDDGPDRVESKSKDDQREPRPQRTRNAVTFF